MKRKKVLLIALLCVVLACTGCTTKKKMSLEEKQAGIAAMNKGDYEKASKHFDKCLELAGDKMNDSVVDTCFYKAAAAYNLGDTEEAVKQYTAIINYDKKEFRAYYLRGCVHLQTGDLKKAKKDFDVAIKNNAKDYKLYIMISQNLRAQGCDEDADAYLEQALKIKAKGKDKAIGQARVYLEMQNYKDARKQLEKAGKSSGETLALWGDLELAEGQYEKALSYFQKGLKKKDADAKQELLRGEIAALEYVGQFDEAKEKMAAYLEEHPDDLDAIREGKFLETR